MGKAAYPQPDGDAFGLPALRLDSGKRPPARGHRRLPALDAGQLSFQAPCFNRRHSGMRRLAQARNPYPPSWLWIPGSRKSAPRNDEVNYLAAARTPVNSGDIFRSVLATRTRSWLNQSSYGDGRSSRRFGPQFATAPICSGTRSGYGWEIGPRRRGPEIARQCGAAVGQERPSGRPGGLFLVRLSLRRRARLARSGRLPRYSAAKEIVDRS